MELQQLLGNAALKSGLTAALGSGSVSHCYLICGPEGSGKRTLARLLCAALQCTGSQPPCGVCDPCRKALSGVHPDVIVVDDPEKKTVSVELARDAKSDLYIRPNEGKRKIYLFPRAQEMTAAAQNALLKVLEEPPAYGTFLLLADSPERLLPTIRSRCVTLRLTPVPEPEATHWLRERYPAASEEAIRAAYRSGGGFLGQAAQALEQGEQQDETALALLAAYAAGDRAAIIELLWKFEKSKEKNKRDPLIVTLRQALRTLGEAMTVKSGAQSAGEPAQTLAANRTAAELAGAYRDLRELLDAAESNVGAGHICGCIAARLR